jgi:hypothetical protein
MSKYIKYIISIYLLILNFSSGNCGEIKFDKINEQFSDSVKNLSTIKGRTQISLKRHNAIYYLNKSHPNYDEFYRILIESNMKKTKIVIVANKLTMNVSYVHQ